MLQRFITYGITEEEDSRIGGVRLKTPVILEAMAFSERQNGAHIYEMLKDLNPDIELRFVYSGVSADSCVSFFFASMFIVLLASDLELTVLPLIQDRWRGLHAPCRAPKANQ